MNRNPINFDIVEQPYRDAFPQSQIGMQMPGGLLCVTSPDEEHTYSMPGNESEADFLNRIGRSRIAGRNLFFEEWPELVLDPEIDD